MDIKIIDKLLGKSSALNELQTAFNKNNVALEQELILGEGDYRAYIERSSEGICYVFTDEAVF
ncbi:hypothetical protein SG34_009190 [Thalassomonas viridans]|uniref:Uncharacterized protein n=1 Tax=Thalassomonas viridans TaxID=137584 RepID=A0AAE9Z6S5_9GAMM|nr:hypothetical protein [Thalassomonas viridans]WDE07039.1 hypothetical protein SG34_009190 [Thalassomonas viridans]